jgi:hypothetical protein
MHAAIKLSVTIPANHRLELKLPDDLPAGPAEIIILSSLSAARPDRLSADEAQLDAAAQEAVGQVDQLARCVGSRAADQVRADPVTPDRACLSHGVGPMHDTNARFRCRVRCAPSGDRRGSGGFVSVLNTGTPHAQACMGGV